MRDEEQGLDYGVESGNYNHASSESGGENFQGSPEPRSDTPRWSPPTHHIDLNDITGEDPWDTTQNQFGFGGAQFSGVEKVKTPPIQEQEYYAGETVCPRGAPGFIADEPVLEHGVYFYCGYAQSLLKKPDFAIGDIVRCDPSSGITRARPWQVKGVHRVDTTVGFAYNIRAVDENKQDIPGPVDKFNVRQNQLQADDCKAE